jgi:hypothetical protein
MIGSSAAVIRRGFSPRFLAGLLAVSGFLVIASPVWSHSHLVQPVPKMQSPALVQQGLASPALISLPVDSSASDPLQSPYPLPWSAIWQRQTQATQQNHSSKLRYASAPLRSPDGQVTAHSEVEIQLDPDFRQSHIFSQLILKTSQGKTLQVIPSSIHLGQETVKETAARNLPGTIAMLVPAAWSPDGQKLLSRQFEAIFGSDVSSDYAVIWERSQQRARTVTPLPLNYDSATLLGWNPHHPNEVLFHTTVMGEKEGSTLAVDYRGTAVASPNPQPVQYGQVPQGPRP